MICRARRSEAIRLWVVSTFTQFFRPSIIANSARRCGAPSGSRAAAACVCALYVVKAARAASRPSRAG
nr:MAG TPA: hypothetical protein [Caudoviricetes sp.]